MVAAANDDESNEQQSGQNMLNSGRSSPTAELLKWPLNHENDDQPNLNNLKNHKIRKHRKVKRSPSVHLNVKDNLTNDSTILTNSIKPNSTLNNLSINDRIQNDQSDELQNFVTINWEPPLDARGTILGYNITLDGMSRYKNEENKEITERFKLIYEIRSNITNEFTVRVNPNTRYQVRMCVVNKAGCGKLSSFSLSSQCDSAPILNKSRIQNLQATLSKRTIMINNYPHISPASHSSTNSEQQEFASQINKDIYSDSKNLDLQLPKNNQLVLNLPRLNEREGRILCYRIVMIRLPKFDQLNFNRKSSNHNQTVNQLNEKIKFMTNNSAVINNQTKLDNLKISNNSMDESQLIESSTEHKSKINSSNMKTGWIKEESNNSILKSSSIDQQNNLNNFDILSILPADPMQLPVYRYEQLNNLNYSFNQFTSNQLNLQNKKDKKIFNKNSMIYLTYLAKEMSSSQFQNEVIIGDKTESSCSECVPNETMQYSSNNQQFLREFNNSSFYSTNNANNNPTASARSTIGRRCVFNGELEPNTNYSGFIEIHVAGINGSRLVQRSGYFRPISTDFQAAQLTTTKTYKTSTQFTNHFDKLSALFGQISDSTAAIVFGTICGSTLLLLIFLCFILFCLKRKATSRSPGKGNKIKKQNNKKIKNSKRNEEKSTNFDKNYNEDNNEQIKLNESHNPSKNQAPIKCLEIECDSINEEGNTMKRQTNACSFNCLELNLENNEWPHPDDRLPPPPPTHMINNNSITHQQITYPQQQPTTILIDATTAQPSLISTNDQIHFLHLNQQTDLNNIYEQNLTNNLMNNINLNYDVNNFNNNLNSDLNGDLNGNLNNNYSVLPFNHLESNGYCLSNQINQLNHQLNHQKSIDEESTTNSINNSINTSVNNSSLNENESDILTAHKWISSEFPMKSIHEVFLERHDNDDQLFQIEFNLIPVQFQDRTFNHSTNSMNKIKNRYQNIKCFDQTRVKLGYKTVSFSQVISTMPRQSSINSTSSSNSGGGVFSTLRRKKNKTTNFEQTNAKKQDDSSSSNSPSILSNNSQQQSNDYIHANHVQLNDTSYILTQSPLENTIKDFWQMILEQNVSIIVQLSDLEEDGRQVCSTYWNDSNCENGLKQVKVFK